MQPSQIYKTPKKQNGTPQSIFLYNGIDRINNDNGYIAGNVVACCFPHNRMKGKLSQSKFIELVFKMSNYMEAN